MYSTWKRYSHVEQQEQQERQELEKQLENMLKGPTEYGRQIERELEPEYRRSQRIIKENTKDLEGRRAEEIRQKRHSLAGYLANLSRLVNRLDDIQRCYEADRIAEYVKKLKTAWELYRYEYSVYIEEDLSESELFRAKQQHEQAKDNYHKCALAACERMRHGTQFRDEERAPSRRQRDDEIISQYSYPGGSTKSKNRSLSSSKKRELQRNAELKRMMAEQAEEIAKLEAEMEKRKIDIELEKQKTVRKLRFQAQIAEKEAELMSEDESDESDLEPPRGTYLYTSTPLTKEEQTTTWVMNENARIHEQDERDKKMRREDDDEYQKDFLTPKRYEDYQKDFQTPKKYEDYQKDFLTPKRYEDYQKDFQTPKKYEDYQKDFLTPKRYEDYQKDFQTPKRYEDYQKDFLTPKRYEDFQQHPLAPKRYDTSAEKNHAQRAWADRKHYPERSREDSIPSRDYNAIMLKLNMLQAMQPVKFSGNADDFPNLRNRLRDNLEDGLLTDGQKMEFLPKFVCGEAYEVVERASGCKYTDVVKLLEDRYGHPAAVATACIEKLTVGPKLAHDDTKALRNFAEQLEAASTKLQGDYEIEANTTSNLKLIVGRLPNYLAGKWGEALYTIREKGRSPKLKDLAAFVKRQAAIKSDPAFSTPTSRNIESRTNNTRPMRSMPRGTNNRPMLKTATFTTDVKLKEAHHNDRKPESPNKPERCICCSGNHDLSRCTQFASKDIQERWNIVKNHRLCHTCLKAGHLRTQCKSNEHCRCGSDRHHHKLLHNPPRPKAAYIEKKTEQREDDKVAQGKDSPSIHQGPSPELRKTEQFTTLVGNTEKTILLHVVPIKIFAAEGNAITTYGLLDNGSRATIINADVAKSLGLKGRKERIAVNTLLNKEEEEFEVAEFKMQSADGRGELITVKEGLISRRFNISEDCLPSNINRSAHSHLMDIEIPEVEVPQVSVLIGKDVDEAHELLEVRKSNEPSCKLQAQRGPLGWVITGSIEGKAQRKNVDLHFTDVENLKLRDQIERFWKIDDYGTRQAVKGQDVLSREDMKAAQMLEETTVLKEGHYETGMLWKADGVKLPNNREQAERRMSSLKKRFQKDRKFEEIYRETMNSYIEKGYARKLSPEEASQVGPRTWYLPHFGVTNVNKPGKVRIVFDAAAEHEGTSLNKNLLQGPDCTNSLLGVLLRFREDRVALVADIEGMFHQVGVRQEDQDSLRFLWWHGGADDPPEEYVMTVHIFGARDSPCVANSTLKKTADDNHDAFDPSTVNTVKKNFYVDDVLKSLPDAKAATRMVHQLTQLCMKGGFKLTKFMSNDRKVLAEIPEEKRATSFLDLKKLQELPTERALGVRWDVESDAFSFKVSELQKPDTMRGVLSTISAVFDPLNFAAPVILPAKRIMQELWKRKLKWDQPLEGDILQKWSVWKSRLPMLEQVSVPRCYFTRSGEQRVSIELHHFCDASEVGYGAVTYLRSAYQDGRIECSFVTAKARTTPIKTLTIPRLELQSAVLATRLDQVVRKELEVNVQRITFWTDSMIVLNYIRNETKRFQTYVANRVTEIREQTTPNQWRHCPGKYNPADDASRGLDIREYLENQRWLKGPEFLWKTKEHWPENKYEEIGMDALEIKKEIYLTVPERKSAVEELTSRYSNWIVLLRRIAWIVKFTEWIKCRRVKEKLITMEDLDNAKMKVARIVQHQAFPEEIQSLKKQHEVKGTSKIASLKPRLEEDGLLRVGGRLAKAPISRDAMHPIILPRKSHVTTILIRYLHEKNGHCGHEQVLAMLREQFWVVQARVAIRQILGRCIKCRKQRAPTINQEMGELPRVRLTPYEPPFTYTGVDYFGPFHVKRGRGRVTEKRWGAIFVCMNSRAVHLEVAKSLETDDFILVLTRFLNRRGHVKEIRSDNGTNFVGADREIKEAIQQIDSPKIADKLMERGCKWVFHPPGAPHMSGVWERLVKTVKRSLKAILGQDTVNEEVLQTVFTEAERISNARPLTRNPLNPDDDEPLTPNHFLNVRPSTNIPSEMIDESDKYSKKRWRQAQLLANHYWKRWLKEYIPSLQERQKWRQPKRNLQIDDIVLLADDNATRNKWPVARVTNVFPGSDGLVRSVEVKTKETTYRRPVTKLCLLEAMDEHSK